MYVGTVVGDIGNVSLARVNGLSIVPPFALYRGLTYLASEVAWDGPGYSLSSLDTGEYLVHK